LGDPFETPIDDPAARYVYGPPPMSRRAKRALAAVVMGLALALCAFIYADELARALEPAPHAYDPRDGAQFAGWMKETLPQYVIAVGKRDDAALAPAREAFIAGSAFHDGLHRRARGLAAAVDGFIAWSSTALALKSERASDELTAIGDEVMRLDRMLRTIGAPFSVDHDIGAVKDGARWKLRFLVRGSEILSISRFTTSTAERQGVDVHVARIKRVDNLNVLDLVHGLTRDGVAFVLEGNARKEVIGRYLPALGGDRVLRDTFGEAPLRSVDDDVIAARLVTLLPEDIRPFREELASLASARRAVLEEAKVHLLARKITILAPEDFFLHDKTCRDYERFIGKRASPDFHARLRSFCASETDVSSSTRDRIARATEALVAHFVRGVERHEARHVVAVSPAPLNDAPPQAAKEMVAYLGALADADDEACLLWDQLRVAMRASAQTERFTATTVAMRALASRLEDTIGVDDRALDCSPAKARARMLLDELFQEGRSLRHVTRADGVALLSSTTD
jgi:hypothetical protein